MTRLGQGAAIVAVLLVAGVWLRRDFFAAPDGGYRSFLVRQMAGEPAGVPTLLAGPDADIVSFYLHRPATILTSSLALEQRLRSEPSAFVLVFHHPGWETAEERRIQELAVRRCRPSDDALVSIYRCGD